MVVMTETRTLAGNNPNPQGKGCVPLLQDWEASRPGVLKQKTPLQIIRDYLLSALVLAAQFRFRPVPGQCYYLYCDRQQWHLSLIGPHEWGKRKPGEFVGSCRLQPDMTWRVDFDNLREGGLPARRIAAFVDGFTSDLSTRRSLLEGLPFYEQQLPYYQRMLATGLAASLHHSITDTGADAVALALPTLTARRLRLA
jgi:hypothetical protein